MSRGMEFALPLIKGDIYTHFELTNYIFNFLNVNVIDGYIIFDMDGQNTPI